MTDLLAQILRWINIPVNAVAAVFLAPIGLAPGWLSATLVAAVAGILLLALFKCTSNQKAIGRVRDTVTADLLALKLFKDSFVVTLQSQGRIFRGAFLLLFCAIPPMLVMLVPVCLLLSQLGLWYQHRPLDVGEHAVITMELSGPADAAWPQVALVSMPTAKVTVGPVRVLSKREICWEIEALQPGDGPIVFDVDGQPVEKQLVVGRGFARVSAKRPGWNAVDMLLHPAETPFARDATVGSIDIAYPERRSWTSGTDSWVIYFFVVSLAFSFLFKPLLGVRI